MWLDSGFLVTSALRGLAIPVALAVASTLVGGCASTGSLGKDSPAEVKQAVVGKRAEERWQALIQRDFDRAYGYFSPASREVIRVSDFSQRMSQFPYRAVKVDKVECEAELCTVSLTLTYDFPQMKMTNVPTPLQESWLIDGGQAWLVYRARGVVAESTPRKAKAVGKISGWLPKRRAM